MKNNHIKKNDEVIVISGNEKGKKGKVLAVDHENGRVIVEGINMATKHKKPRRQGEAGGIIKQEAALSMSNVMHICKKLRRTAKHQHKCRPKSFLHNRNLPFLFLY